MGNYFHVTRNVDGSESIRHIGKASAGWVFMLRIYPAENLISLRKWVDLWTTTDGFIRDEYGKRFSIIRMIMEIADRPYFQRSGLNRAIGPGIHATPSTYDLHVSGQVKEDGW